MKKIFILIALSFLSACSESVQRGAGKVLDNAGSVIESGSDKMITTPTPAGEDKVEDSARQVLENAGSVIKTGEEGQKKVIAPTP